MANALAKSSHPKTLVAAPSNPIDVIAKDHATHSSLCDSLEEIADGLPSRFDQKLCAEVAQMLRSELRIHHLDEENGLFPLLLKHATKEQGLSEIIEHLIFEHEADESFASELLENLDLMAAGSGPKNPDMLGYMLRGFFEGYRRHIAWENAVLLPLARRCLTVSDLETLTRRMAENRNNTH